MNSIRPRATLLLVTTCILAFTMSCAHLNVDVDVYKGPLTDHVDVQTQRTATLAMAAKPLLLRLRYTLERDKRAQLVKEGDLCKACSDAWLERLEHASDFLAPPYADPGNPAKLDQPRQHPCRQQCERADDPSFPFRSHDALFVNRVLAEYSSYYETRASLLQNNRFRDDAVQRDAFDDALTRQPPLISPVPLGAWWLWLPGRSAKSPTAPEQAATMQEIARSASGPLTLDRVGFARGTYMESAPPPKNVVVDENLPQYKRFRQYMGALYRARGSQRRGFEWLFENYRRQREKLGDEFFKQQSPLDESDIVPRDSYYKEKVELYDAMLYFAERVVFDADNHYLSHDDERRRCCFSIFDPADPSAKYVTTLQAIGNTVLVSLNELREEAEMRTKLDHATNAEAAALTAALNPPAIEVIQGLITAAHHRATEAAKPLSADGKKPPFDIEQLKKDAADKDNLVKKRDVDLQSAHAAVSDAEAKAALSKRLADLLGAAGKPDTSSKKDGCPSQPMPNPFQGVLSATQPTDATADAVRDELLSALKAIVPKTPAEMDRIDQLAQRLNALTFGTTAPQKRAAAIQAVRDAATRRATADAADAARALVPVQRAQAVLQTAREDARKAEILRDAAQMYNQYEAIAKAIESLTKVVVDKADADRREKIFGTARVHLLNELREALKKIPEPAKKPWTPDQAKIEANNDAVRDSLKNAIIYVESFPADAMGGEVIAVKDIGAKGVLDGRIAQLRHQYIEDIRKFGPDEPISRNAAAALAQAYEQRGAMIHLHPAWAYLRSSYPAASMQMTGGRRFKNLLLEDALKAVPFAGEIGRALEECGNEIDYETLNQIDKQSWQTVNTVSVKGGGNTNYVIAKDDVGNWYVKNYSANPEKVIQGATNLALFGLGSMLSGSPNLSQVQQGTPAAVAPGLPGRQFAQVQSNYQKQTDSDLTEVRTKANNVAKDLETAWAATESVKGYRAKLIERATATQTQYVKDAAKEPEAGKPIPAQADQVITILQALRRYHNAMVGEVRATIAPDKESAEKSLDDATAKSDAIKKKEGATEEEKTAADADVKAAKAKYDAIVQAEKDALATLKSQVATKVKDWRDSREKTAQKYELGLTIIGDSLVAPPAPAPAPSPPAQFGAR